MFLIKNCTVNKLFFISENKNTDYVIKFMKITSNSTHNTQKRQKAQNDKKLVF